MLSEKAKGKRRAVEVESPSNIGPSGSGTNEPREEPTKRQLVIRFAEGAPDLTVSVGKQDTVRDIKRNIHGVRPELKDRRIRLIHLGRLLTDGTFLYSWLSSLEEKQKRASAANVEDEEGSSKAVTLKPATTWIHCSVGPSLEPGEEVEEGEEGKQEQLQPLRGFDRLSAVGFSEDDIANFRRQFHSQSSTNYLDDHFETEEDYDEHARALEEQWIDSIDNAGSASLSQSANSSNSTILQGITMGFFFPLIPFYFMRSQKPAVFWEDGTEAEPVPNVIFSRRMQMGLVVGFLVNLMFGLWRYLLDGS
ncbi:hypothetical protein FA13DRAFT_907122 [Coprinellus micaceus]|uniref:Ubiquitin-like domain-containing protein n=1 Tax=Coprinellus micaceus TaxID=71717 RepID=A0A4Y7TTD8_COPMI|nr:hypothetical protein FA13DRAFT_907122 [Coprinellus micaceus]